MKIILIYLSSLFFFQSCKKIDKSEVIIEGAGFGKNIKKIYLTEARKWDVFLDSADCINGRFQLKYKPSLPFEPFLATVSYLDENKVKQNLWVRNEELTKQDGKNHASSAFMLDYGVTKFSPFNLQSPGSEVIMKGGREQLLSQKYNHLNFGYVPNARTQAREERLAEVIGIIKDNPYSFYLLMKINQNKLRYSKSELKEIINYFDQDVKGSRLGQQLKAHIENTLDPGENTRPLSLVSSLGERKDNINSSAQLNMLIFWASWCGPCRDEIPQLKELYKSVKDKNFYMASISTDKSDAPWLTALKQENMTWDQFRVDEKDRIKIFALYSYSAIPLVVFTDKNGKELKRFKGYDAGNLSGYKKIISEHLQVKVD